MGDTQRSQTISTETQGDAEQAFCNTGKTFTGQTESETPLMLYEENSFGRLRMMAENNPGMVFTSLAHRINLGLLRDSFKLVRKSVAAGADGMTAKEYAGNLDENLYNLLERLRRGQYAATPVKRIWLDKENGEKRPISIPVLEDKIVQKAAEPSYTSYMT